MRRRLGSLAALAFTGALGCANAGQVLNNALATALTAPVFSENFEAPATANYSVVRAGQSFTTQRNTWQVSAGSVDVVNATVRTETVAADGRQLIDLAGSPGAGALSSSFPTTLGQRYTLAFTYGRNNGIGAKPALARVELLGASTLLRAELKHAAPTAFNALQRFSMPFVADSASTSLRFTSLVGGNAGITVDAISVTGSAAAVAPRNLSGEYVSLERGRATLTQAGNDVRILTTWTQIPGGPHGEFSGKLAGNRITGEWYSHHQNRGWYRWVANVRPNGEID